MRMFVVVSILLLWSSSAVAQDGSHLQLGRLMTLEQLNVNLSGARDYIAECPIKPWRCTGHTEVSVKLDRYRWQELVFVNALVNLQVSYEEELPDFDVWQDDVRITEGDCEDYALVKRRLLIAKGWPAGALSIAIGRVKKDDRQLHAILIARTDKGYFVLNQHYDEVIHWDEARFYSLLVRQASEDPKQWYEIVNQTIAVVGSK